MISPTALENVPILYVKTRWKCKDVIMTKGQQMIQIKVESLKKKKNPAMTAKPESTKGLQLQSESNVAVATKSRIPEVKIDGVSNNDLDTG